MKLFFTFLSFSIFFTLSYAQRLEFLHLPAIDLPTINAVNPHNHHDHDHGSVSTIVDRATQDKTLLSDHTTSKPASLVINNNNNNKPESTAQFELHYFGKNLRPVRLFNRFTFPRTTFRFFPRRCNHNELNQRFIPDGEMDQNVVQFMFKKDETMKKEIKGKENEKERRVPRVINNGPFSDVMLPQQVARKYEAEMNMMIFNKPRLQHHDRARDDQKKKDIKSDDQKMGEKRDDRVDGSKEREHEVVYKIRKFLNYF